MDLLTVMEKEEFRKQELEEYLNQESIIELLNLLPDKRFEELKKEIIEEIIEEEYIK